MIWITFEDLSNVILQLSIMANIMYLSLEKQLELSPFKASAGRDDKIQEFSLYSNCLFSIKTSLKT